MSPVIEPCGLRGETYEWRKIRNKKTFASVTSS